MTDGILTWVFSIAVFLILITLILQLLPERFKKYLNFYTGILLMLIAIKPITSFLKIDASISSYFELGKMALELEEISNSLNLTRDVTEGKLIDEYNTIIEENITGLLIEYGYTIIDILIDWNLDAESEEYGSIKKIDIILRNKSTSGSISGIRPIEPIIIGRQEDKNATAAATKPEIAEIKNKLVGFYNLSEAHINITIQE